MARCEVCCVWRLCQVSLVTVFVLSQSIEETGPCDPLASDPAELCAEGMCWCYGAEACCSCHWLEVSYPESLPGHITSLSVTECEFASLRLRENFTTDLANISHLHLMENEISSLPENAFAGTKMDVLDLSFNHISTLPETAFASAQIDTLDLSTNSMSSLPQNVFAGAKFNSLDLSDNRIPSLPPNAFTGAEIGALYLYENAITMLPENAFANAKIHYLDLSSNRISRLSQNAFTGANISILILLDNKISRLPQNVFAGVGIKHLNLGSNSITRLSRNTFSTTQMDFLELSDNRISMLPQDVFAGAKIKHLDLSNNGMVSLLQNTFQGAQIDFLNLAENSITKLPENAFAGAKIDDLYLSDNSFSMLSANVFVGAEINYLELDNAGISRMSPYAFLESKFDVIILSNNDISSLSQNFFLGATINRLDLSHNRITGVPWNMFGGQILKADPSGENFSTPILTADIHQNITSNISEIKLDHNLYSGEYNLEGLCAVHSLHTLYIRQCFFTTIRLPCPLSRLSTLDLAQNSLADFPTTCGPTGESMFPRLMVLNITRNQIVYFFGYDICLPSLRHLDMSYNQITAFYSSAFGSLNFPLLKKLFLGHQSVHFLLRGYDRSGLGINDFAFNNENIEELDLSGIGLNFADSLKVGEDAFANCSCLQYLYLSSNNFTFVDDNRFLELFGHLHSLVKLSISNSRFQLVSTRTFANFVNLTTLLLNDNMIAGVPDGAFDSLGKLHTLYLHNNKIRTVDERTFSRHLREQLSSLTLGYNPFFCSCDLMWFRQWFVTDQTQLFKDVIDHSDSYGCQNIPGMAVANFSMTEQACLLSQQTNLLLIQFCSIFIFILMLVSVVFRYRWHLRLLMYEVFRGRDDLRRQRLRANNFDFDVFVSYASEDLPWVREHLMPKLENELGLRPCIHDRDFIPGCHIVDNIVRSVESSKKILMVFSAHFVRSQWCQFELALCLSHVLDYDDALIVVCVDDVTSRQMTSAMMAVIKTTTYIQWREEEEDAVASFWGRLGLALHEILPHDHQYV